MIETIAKLLGSFANSLQTVGHQLSLTESECSLWGVLMPEQPNADEFKSLFYGMSLYMNPFELEASMPWVVVFVNKAIAPMAMGGGDQLILTGQLIRQIVDALSVL